MSTPFVSLAGYNREEVAISHSRQANQSRQTHLIMRGRHRRVVERLQAGP